MPLPRRRSVQPSGVFPESPLAALELARVLPEGSVVVQEILRVLSEGQMSVLDVVRVVPQGQVAALAASEQAFREWIRRRQARGSPALIGAIELAQGPRELIQDAVGFGDGR